MSLAILDTINAAWFGSTGSWAIIGIVVMIFFFIAFLIVGMPFKYAVMFTSPLALAFVEIGWFGQIIATIFWLLIAAIGIFILITQISDR